MTPDVSESFGIPSCMPACGFRMGGLIYVFFRAAFSAPGQEAFQLRCLGLGLGLGLFVVACRLLVRDVCFGVETKQLCHETFKFRNMIAQTKQPEMQFHETWNNAKSHEATRSVT